MALLFRFATVWYSAKKGEYTRVPRILVIIFIGIAFVPILNWLSSIILTVLFLVVMFSFDDGDDIKPRELKDNKFNRWLFKN
jgi:hypothetical protein